MHRSAPLAAAMVVLVLLSGCQGPPPDPSSGAHPVRQAKVRYDRWAAGKSRPVADPARPGHGDPTLDVLHYDLRLSWDPSAEMLTGLATVAIRPTADADAIRLDFAPFHLDRVLVGAQVVDDATLDGAKLVAPAFVRKNLPITLTVAYHGQPVANPAGGLTVTPEHGVRTAPEPYGASTWYPVNDLPSDEALYDISVNVPSGWSAVTGGTPNGRNLGTFYYRSPVPVAGYQQTLAIGRYREFGMVGPRGLPLTFWYRPGTDEELLPTIRRSTGYLTFLASRFGKYPFRTGGAVVVDSTTSASTQQMITIGGRPGPTGGALADTLVREWALQWFGDSVTPATWNDRWLSEGFATYAQYLYEQSAHHTSNQSLDRLLRKADAAARRRYGPPGHVRTPESATTDAYVSSAAMVHQLRMKLGDKRFFALAKAWVQKHRNTDQTRASFIAFVNHTTGKNFTGLINSWLDSPTTPR